MLRAFQWDLGQKRQAFQMRSDFASDKKETSVEFTFEHQGKIYYIKRQPKQVLAGRGGKPVEKRQKSNWSIQDLIKKS